MYDKQYMTHLSNLQCLEKQEKLKFWLDAIHGHNLIIVSNNCSFILTSAILISMILKINICIYYIWLYFAWPIPVRVIS